MATPPDLRAPHYLGLRYAGGVPHGLAHNRVYVSVRGTSMRVTSHLSNNDANLDRLLAVLEAEA
jgi:hypothetical protein